MHLGLKAKSVVVKVDTLKFSIRDAKHNLLYKTLKPLATALVEKQIRKAIEGSITTGMEYVDGQLVSVRDHMPSAKATGGESRTKVLQEVQTVIVFIQPKLLLIIAPLFQMFTKKKDESSTWSTTSRVRHLQFKVVHNKWNSIPDTAILKQILGHCWTRLKSSLLVSDLVRSGQGSRTS